MEMDSTEMWYIMTRKQQLYGRRTLLLGLQEFLKKKNFCEGNLSLHELMDTLNMYTKYVLHPCKFI